MYVCIIPPEQIFDSNYEFIPMIWHIFVKMPTVSKLVLMFVTFTDWDDVSLVNVRSSSPEVFCKKVILKIFAKFIEKHLCQSFLFNTVVGLRPATLLKKRLWHRCFPVNFGKYLRTPLLYNTSGGCFYNVENRTVWFVKTL